MYFQVAYPSEKSTVHLVHSVEPVDAAQATFENGSGMRAPAPRAKVVTWAEIGSKKDKSALNSTAVSLCERFRFRARRGGCFANHT
jgi:hypothetical protein